MILFFFQIKTLPKSFSPLNLNLIIWKSYWNFSTYYVYIGIAIHYILMWKACVFFTLIFFISFVLPRNWQENRYVPNVAYYWGRKFVKSKFLQILICFVFILNFPLNCSSSFSSYFTEFIHCLCECLLSLVGWIKEVW